MRTPDFIAIDWGSTAFRAWAMGLDGTILGAVTAEDGLKSVSNRDFDGVVSRHCGAWLSAHPEVPVILCGMVGSRTGWVEAPYVDCPVAPRLLAAQAAPLTIAGHRAAISAPIRTPDRNDDTAAGASVPPSALARAAKTACDSA